ncbi:hypothetical protein [Sphingomonas sp. HDW15A]|uniref:hypothetical protein n=1 Tax=Sphingomonas sp. HDW15A TaxID=2714942 RepID=UPI0019CF54AC|nr:hypothetical protein [Sphingomonas sp. HDW15A]
MMIRRFAILALPLAITACGDTAPLRPAAGQSLPVKPALAQTTPDASDLLETTPMAAPERVDELITRSQRRETDRFDLPPPDGRAAPAAPAAEPQDAEDETRVGEPE